MPAWVTRSAYDLPMSHGRHSQPRPPRSELPVLVLAALLALAAAVTPMLVDGLLVMRLAIVGLAAACLLTLLVAQRSGRRQIAALHREASQRSSEIRTLRIEFDRVNTVQSDLSVELIRLREQMSQYVTPVPAEPDPVYPSLHLPLVRAAFAAEVPPPAPPRQLPASKVAAQRHRNTPEHSAVGVDADAGSDAMPPRKLLDLTASEIARLRRAN